MAAFHLLVLLPFLQLRAALPAVADGLATIEQEIRAADEAQKAAAVAGGGIERFRRTLAADPEQLRSAIADLVARGRAVAGPRGDPYKAVIRIPREGPRPATAPAVEEVLVEEAVRRQIGRQMEALSLSLEAALETLRLLKNAPAETEETLRATQEAVGREVVGLNQILREAFASEPNFWLRWQRQGATFGAASARAEEATRRIEEALRALNRRMAAAAVVAKGRQQAQEDRIRALRAKQADLNERMKEFARRLEWLPIGLDDAMRLYPMVAGVLTLTMLFRLRRILVLRRALAGVDLDLVAPSWIVGSPSSPGRWWALLLIAAPLIATIHAAVAALTDRGLFVTVLGEPSQTMMAGYAAGYVLLILVGMGQLLVVTRGLMIAPR